MGLRCDTIGALAEYLFRRTLGARVEVLFEQASVERGDACLGSYAYEPLVYVGRDVYLRIDPRRLSRASIAHRIDLAMDYRLTAFLVPATSITTNENDELGNIQELAESVDEVVVSALDGETFLIWRTQHS